MLANENGPCYRNVLGHCESPNQLHKYWYFLPQVRTAEAPLSSPKHVSPVWVPLMCPWVLLPVWHRGCYFVKCAVTVHSEHIHSWVSVCSPGYPGTLLCRPCWPFTHRDLSPKSGIKVLHHYYQFSLKYPYLWRQEPLLRMRTSSFFSFLWRPIQYTVLCWYPRPNSVKWPQLFWLFWESLTAVGWAVCLEICTFCPKGSDPSGRLFFFFKLRSFSLGVVCGPSGPLLKCYHICLHSHIPTPVVGVSVSFRLERGSTYTTTPRAQPYLY